jgi:hypothetical protein
MTYEGARSTTGPYLGVLGVTATTIGVVSAFGELVGYAVRLGSGYLADRSGRYWTDTIFGYLLTPFAVPLLALAGNWQIAVVLIITERMGRTVRSPPRDAMLSHAAGQTGLGWGFGLHQALDQTVAVVGPLFVSGVLFLGSDYRAAFAVLLAPALVSISLILVARVLFPRPHDIDLATPALETEGLDPTFRVYLVAVAFIAAGYADFALIAYHFGTAAGDAGDMDPDRLCDRDGRRRCRRPRAGIAVRPHRVASDDPRDGHLGSRRTAGFSRRLLQAVLGMVCWGIGTGAQDRSCARRSHGWHPGSGARPPSAFSTRSTASPGLPVASFSHPLRPLDRWCGHRFDGAAGGGASAPALVGLPARRVIGIAPTPAIP